MSFPISFLFPAILTAILIIYLSCNNHPSSFYDLTLSNIFDYYISIMSAYIVAVFIGSKLSKNEKINSIQLRAVENFEEKFKQLIRDMDHHISVQNDSELFQTIIYSFSELDLDIQTLESIVFNKNGKCKDLIIKIQSDFVSHQIVMTNYPPINSTEYDASQISKHRRLSRSILRNLVALKKMIYN